MNIVITTWTVVSTAYAGYAAYGYLVKRYHFSKPKAAIVFQRQMWVAENGAYSAGGILLLQMQNLPSEQQHGLIDVISGASDSERFNLTQDTLEYWGYDLAVLEKK